MREKNIWTDEECRRNSVGNSSLMIETGACHAPVNNRQGRKGVLRMLKQPERESRNVNDLFYEMDGRQIQKMNKVLADVELTKAEEKTLIWLAGWEESTVDYLMSVIEKTARIVLNKNKPSAFESEIDPSHKLRLCSAYFALAGGKPPTGG